MSFLVVRLPQSLREAPAELQQKRVTKEKAKAKSPLIADDSASNVSVDSHVSIPVAILPEGAVDINDNVVEFQQPQPEEPPPPSPPSFVFDAGTLASVFQILNTFLSKFEGSSTPQLEDVGSARRSSTAGPSDETRALIPLLRFQIRPPRVLMRPLDLPRP